MTNDVAGYGQAQAGAKPNPLSLSENIIRYGLIIGVILTPFMMWRFHPAIQFTFSDGCFLIAAVFAFASGRLNLRPFGDLTPWWLMSFCLMLFALGASSLINGDPLRFAITGSQYVLAYMALPYFLFSGTEGIEIRLAKFFVGAIVAVQAVSILLFYLHADQPGSLQWINHNFVTGGGRLGSFLASANRNAALISLTLPFMFYFTKKRLFPLWFCVGGIAILAFALVLTASVTGFVTSIAAVLIFAIASYGVRAWKPLAGVVGALFLAVAAGLPIPATFQERVLSAFAEGDISEAGTFGGRMQLIEEALEFSSNTYFLGMGADQFRVVSDQGAPVHNILLLIWTEGGTFALLGWMLAMGILTLIAFRTIKFDKTAAALTLSVTLGFFIISNASTHLYARLWVVPVLIAARLAVVAAERMQRQSDEGVEERPLSPNPKSSYRNISPFPIRG
jgi:O-antigen ligase